MRSKNRVSLIAIYRFLASLLIALSALTGAANAQNPVPLINQPLVPEAIAPGSSGFTLTVNGTGFASSTVVNWNGSARATTFLSSSRLEATILPSDIAKAETASVTVVNPGAGGGTSNVAFFQVTPPSSSIALSAPIGFSAGSGPLSAAVGDFNGDGKLDLAVANGNSNNVSILLGKGDGTFQTHVDYPTGAQPSSVAVGDFNGDGKLDLAIANQNCASPPCNAGSVSILLGNGDGTFEPAMEFSTGPAPYSVAVGDFNGDGKLDLAIANSGPPIPSDISILLGNGDGTFQPAVYYGTGSGTGPASVAVGDFNHDGKLDLAVANFSCGTPCGNIAVLLGNGDGTFQPAVNYNAGKQPISIAIGDFNNDGNLDLAVGNASSSNVSVLLGNGDGTFKAPVNYSVPSDAVSVAVGDFNGDGRLDLVVAAASCRGCTYVSLLLGNGDGTFTAAVNYAAGTNPNSVALGDFNGDGRLDIAVADSGSTTVPVLLQTPIVSLSKTSLTFSNQVVGTSSPSQMVTLSNTSVLPLNISSIAVTGTNATDFRQTNTCSSSLPPGGECTITVTFAPTQVRPRTASVTITDNAAGSPQQIALSGTGVVSGPNATLSPTSLTFATQLVGTTSPAQSVTLSDYGTAALSITSIVVSGDFSQTNTCGSSLAAGASCTISTTFKPTQTGPRTGAVSITDNAPGSPQMIGLQGTGTVVEFYPTSLAFHCHNQPNTCPPPPQTTTLTNTGSTTLGISSITITGSTTFSQTNTCGSSVVSKGSCTITVAFKSSSRGTFSGAVSVSDNGGGSPHQVPLSATESKTGAGALAVRSSMAAHITASVPAPTGPMHVGTRIMDLVDSRRDDPFLADGTKRELLVRFWYPASLGQGCEPAEYTSPAVWSYFSQLAEFPLPEVKTNSCQDAPATGGAHPVVVFTHGYTGTFTDYTSLFEDLASRGYVVASVDHTYEATAVEFPNGRLVKSVFGSHLAESTWRRDEQSLALAVSVRPKDLKFVMDEMARVNGEVSGPFAGKLDLTRVAVAGHSLGGLAALLGLKQDARFKAAVLLDASVPDGSASLTETPVLVLAMGREQWSDEECRLWSDLRGPRFAVNLKGAEHLTPSDAVWLAKGAIKAGPMGTEKSIAAVRSYIAAFLDTNLRGKPSGALLSRSSSDYPDAVVTAQKQLLCGEPIDH
jgi:dienelactone hydrolase